jgi:hypothetical protein
MAIVFLPYWFPLLYRFLFGALLVHFARSNLSRNGQKTQLEKLSKYLVNKDKYGCIGFGQKATCMFCKQDVVGSNPFGSTNDFNDLAGLPLSHFL